MPEEHDPGFETPPPSIGPDAGTPQWRVYLGSTGSDAGHEPTALSKLLSLDVYGSSLLSRRGATEMGFVALILAVIFLFDLAAWSLLFNIVFKTAVAHDGARLALAVLVAGLFALAVLVYERQFVTSDTSAGWRKLLAPMGLRLGVIVASALITAQPVELMVFRGPIQNHTHQEQVREHAVGLLLDLRDLDARTRETDRSREGIDRSYEAGRLQEYDERIRGTEVQVEDLRKELLDEAEKLRNWKWAEGARREEVATAQAALQAVHASVEPSAADLEAATRALATAQKRLAQATRNRRGHQTRVGDLENEIEVGTEALARLRVDRVAVYRQYDEERDEVEDQVEEELGRLGREAQALRRWFQDLVSLEPGTVPAPRKIGGITYSFAPQEYDFLEQLRVLKDLRQARSPRWPGTTSEDLRELARELGIRDVRNCEVAECTGEERQMWQGQREKARLLLWSWLVVYALALIIPCLVIAIKLLLPADLRAYYSSRHQAAAGNPEAMNLLSVAHAVGERE